MAGGCIDGEDVRKNYTKDEIFALLLAECPKVPHGPWQRLRHWWKHKLGHVIHIHVFHGVESEGRDYAIGISTECADKGRVLRLSIEGKSFVRTGEQSKWDQVRDKKE